MAKLGEERNFWETELGIRVSQKNLKLKIQKVTFLTEIDISF